MLIATWGLGIPPRAILGDAATYVGQPPYLGLFSNLGVLGWWTAAVSCFLAGFVLPKGMAPFRAAVLAGGALSAMLGIDDVALLHEEVLPSLGVPQSRTYAVYGLATLWYLWRFRGFHRAMDTGLLVAALALLGSSAAIDFTVYNVLPRFGVRLQVVIDAWLSPNLAAVADAALGPGETVLTSYRRILEDGSKLAGITVWATYHTLAAWRVLRVQVGNGAR